METNTQRGNTYHFYDPWGRVFYTERTEGTNETRKSVSWIGRNAFGDVTETDIWTADGNSYAASFTVYDVLGHAVASTNELGNVTENTYDTQGRIVSVSGATYPVRYAHDTAGRMTGLSTTRDETAWDETTWTYHPQTGLPAAKTYADGSKRG